jgi:NAD-reducing hydrogenase large subunit
MKQRTLEVGPITRIEGLLKVSVDLNENGNVQEAHANILEFRGFEKFLTGRLFYKTPIIATRICGICPVPHHLAAAKAMDRIVGGEQLTPTAEKVRRLMHYGQILQSHALHFFYLATPDLLFGTDGTATSAFGAPVAQRNFIAVAAKYPELAVQGVMMRKFGQEVIKATAGKKIHGTGAIPGGVNKNLSLAERDALLQDVPQMLSAMDIFVLPSINEGMGRAVVEAMAMAKTPQNILMFKVTANAATARAISQYISSARKPWPQYGKLPAGGTCGVIEGTSRGTAAQ